MLTALRYPVIERQTTLCPSDDVITVARLSQRSLAAKTLTFWPTPMCLTWLMDTAKYLPAADCAGSSTGKMPPTNQECADEDSGRIRGSAVAVAVARDADSPSELVGRILEQARTQTAVLQKVQ